MKDMPERACESCNWWIYACIWFNPTWPSNSRGGVCLAHDRCEWTPHSVLAGVFRENVPDHDYVARTIQTEMQPLVLFRSTDIPGWWCASRGGQDIALAESKLRAYELLLYFENRARDEEPCTIFDIGIFIPEGGGWRKPKPWRLWRRDGSSFDLALVRQLAIVCAKCTTIPEARAVVAQMGLEVAECSTCGRWINGRCTVQQNKDWSWCQNESSWTPRAKEVRDGR